MEPKKKDLMMASMDDFWGSDYKIGQPKINVPKLKTSEDESFDALWGRGNYAPMPRIPSPAHGNKYIADVRPVNYKNPVKYQPNVINARSQLAQLQADLQRKQIEDKINAINARRMQNNIRTAQQIGGAAVNTTKTIYSKSAPVVKKGIANVTDFAKKYLSHTKVSTESKEPVGLGGAIYTANKAAGKKSIYD